MTALLALALLGAGPDGGATAFRWAVPDTVAMTRVGSEGLELAGLPMEIYAVRTRLSGEDLLRYFTRRFEEEGFFIPPRNLEIRGLKLPRVTALDPEAMVSYLVYCWPEPDGTTSAIVGAANLKGRKPRAGNGTLPVFPGASAVTSFNMEYAQGLSYRATATTAEVIDFYRATLPSGGWKEREPGAFVKDSRVLRVLAKQDKDGLGIVVLDEPDLPALTKKP